MSNQPRKAIMNKWVSIKDRMPIEAGKYKALLNGLSLTVSFDSLCGFMDEKCTFQIKNITHWYDGKYNKHLLEGE